jgi:cytochrome P450
VKLNAELRSAAVTPAVLAFVASERVRRHRVPVCAALQRLDPVHRSPLGVMVLSRHEHVAAVLRDPTFGSDERKADRSLVHLGVLDRFFAAPAVDEPAEFLELFRRLMLFTDPPDHTRLRSLVSKAFTPRRVERLSGRIDELIDELLAPARERGSIEIMQEFAYPLPARVICELLGIPDDTVDLFVREAPSLAIALDPSPMRTAAGIRAANRAQRVLSAYLAELVDERRKRPRDDLLSGLVHAEEDGRRLAGDELIAMVLLLVLAGHETTANVIGNAAVRLARDPLTRSRVAAADDSQLRNAVEEFLRLDGAVQIAERIALADTRIGDRRVRCGQIVMLLLGAANRDGRVFPRPHEFRLDRDKNPHLAFGAGHHYCIGAPLARLELAAALRAVATLPEGTRMVHRPEPRKSFTIAGPERLDLAWPPPRATA